MKTYRVDEIVVLAFATLLASVLTIMAFSWTWVMLVK
jgi:hypothetical protein